MEGLCQMLSAMNATTTRNVISSTMKHLLVCNGGRRFMFSHGFSFLLVGQLEATVEAWHTDVRIHIKNIKGENITWQHSSSNNYIH